MVCSVNGWRFFQWTADRMPSLLLGQSHHFRFNNHDVLLLLDDGHHAPSPGRILDDVGGAFAMGAIGGAVWHSVKGAKNSPRVL